MDNNFIEVHLPCPCGTSSDAFGLNSDGSGFCFSCSKFFKSKDVQGENKISTNLKEYDEIDGEVSIQSHRNISLPAFNFYDVQTKSVDGVPKEVGFKYPNGAYKIRLLSEKKFWNAGPMRDAGLFGTDKFDPGSKDSITITEGEFDSLAAWDMLRGNSACVSVKSASSAKKDCTKEWDYINSFKKIVLCFDNDDPGRNATQEVASLFDFNKVYQVKFNKFKDANDYLLNQEVNEFVQLWRNARRFAPDNIISSFGEIERALEDSKEDLIGTYPFHQLNASLYGLHQGEVVLFTGLEGTGKTEVLRAMEHHLLTTTKYPVGIIHLEEDNATTIKAIAGYELQVPAVLPDCGLSREDILSGYKKAVGDDEGRVHLYTSFDVENENAFLDNVRFLAAAAGCKFIFLDHITWLATGLADEDERKKLDRLSQKLKLLAKELRFCLIEISHVNDNGQTRGSRNISKVANSRINITRNLTAADELERNTLWFTIEKARLGGRTGPGGKAIMNSMTGRLEDFDTRM